MSEAEWITRRNVRQQARKYKPKVFTQGSRVEKVDDHLEWKLLDEADNDPLPLPLNQQIIEELQQLKQLLERKSIKLILDF